MGVRGIIKDLPYSTYPENVYCLFRGIPYKEKRESTEMWLGMSIDLIKDSRVHLDFIKSCERRMDSIVREIYEDVFINGLTVPEVARKRGRTNMCIANHLNKIHTRITCLRQFWRDMGSIYGQPLARIGQKTYSRYFRYLCDRGILSETPLPLHIGTGFGALSSKEYPVDYCKGVVNVLHRLGYPSISELSETVALRPDEFTDEERDEVQQFIVATHIRCCLAKGAVLTDYDLKPYSEIYGVTGKNRLIYDVFNTLSYGFECGELGDPLGNDIALALLDNDVAVVAKLYYKEELSVEEIANKLGKSVEAVKELRRSAIYAIRQPNIIKYLLCGLRKANPSDFSTEHRRNRMQPVVDDLLSREKLSSTELWYWSGETKFLRHVVNTYIQGADKVLTLKDIEIMSDEDIINAFKPHILYNINQSVILDRNMRTGEDILDVYDDLFIKDLNQDIVAYVRYYNQARRYELNLGAYYPELEKPVRPMLMLVPRWKARELHRLWHMHKETKSAESAAVAEDSDITQGDDVKATTNLF